ncbi:MAG TPA: DUF763 domain-containing protein [Candidatus Acidoferrum sp.]|nr:DUF763 domain-containing protein [Candidatus Acidoferrum sp.]
MQRTGVAKLPLHYGKAPEWLTGRMKKLASQIVTLILDEYGMDDFLRRISDPFWFQALGCVLGYDWHSSGVTTVLTGVLKEAIKPEEHGIGVCGGKGRTSRQTPFEIENIGYKFSLSESDINNLIHASRLSAKVDNTAVQAGYQLYHHAFFASENRKWAVVQQGMCAQDRTARRYHWLSENVDNFVVEPHNAIVGEARREYALDMTARESEDCRKVSVDLVNDSPGKIMHMLTPTRQKSLDEWICFNVKKSIKKPEVAFLSMPRNINWKALRNAYEFQPKDYEEFLGLKGIGPATVRGLALVAELVYGAKPSWKDPVKYSFAYGGKDGVPFPVNRKAMDDSIQMLKETIDASKIGDKEKTWSLQRLRKFVPQDVNNKSS